MRVTLVVLCAVAASAVAAPSSRPVTVFLERGGDGETIPRFGGGDRVWAATVGCVKQHFAPFQVDIVDQRPRGSDFITAVVGGKASMLGLNDRTTNGVGPYDGSVLRTATVHVFSQVGTGERDVANLCAVAAHEIGHALGLDHSYTCGDVMSYFNDQCGTQRFLDTEGPCGESASRDCANGDETQNSFQRLAQNVGLRGGAGPKVEPPGTTAPVDDEADDAADDADVDDSAGAMDPSDTDDIDAATDTDVGNVDADDDDVDDEDADNDDVVPPCHASTDPWA
jgi:hypothetical protein